MTSSPISCSRISDFNLINTIQLENYCIVYFTRGKGFITIDFKKIAYQKDSLFLLSKNQLLRLNNAKENDGFIIQISSEYLDLITIKTSFLNRKRLFNYWINDPKVTTSNENFYSIILSLYKECKATKNPIDVIILKNTLTGLLLKIHKAYSFSSEINKSEIFFNQFKFLVDYKLKQTRNALDYATELNISYKHLNVICKQNAHMTAKDFIIESTVLELKRQQNLGLSTNQISRKLGFDEPTNFVKFRKKHLLEVS